SFPSPFGRGWREAPGEGSSLAWFHPWSLLQSASLPPPRVSHAMPPASRQRVNLDLSRWERDLLR
ncbi:MAG: hypothetical protein ACREPH_00420, partial [Rhodanobacteraceae bacterium]